jgi:hypothetical protein
MDAKQNGKDSKGIGARLLEKMLMPIVATAAGAAASYAAKKAPQLLDEKVLPRVRELVNAAGTGAEGLPAKAKAAAGDAGDVAEGLADRARPAAGDAAEAVRGATKTNGHREKRISSKELERRQKERATARKQRRTSGK